MIIENSFLKLPELLTSSFDHRDTYEATVGHYFVSAILMPYRHVLLEKPYPTKAANGKHIHSDVFIDLDGVIDTQGRMASYGARVQNWVEIKAFLASTRSDNSDPKTNNVGKVLRDLLRICILPEELQGSIRQNGRYFILVCSDPAQDHLALRERSWFTDILKEGNARSKIILSDEPETLRKAVGLGFVANPDLNLEIQVHTTTFQPDRNHSLPVFWGYLIRIIQFRITSQGKKSEYDDIPNDKWDEIRIQSLTELRKVILNRM
jgi:hypothetical protein